MFLLNVFEKYRFACEKVSFELVFYQNEDILFRDFLFLRVFGLKMV